MSGARQPESMEIHCVRAGLWRAEGYIVERVATGGMVWWQVFHDHDDGKREFHGKRRTLREAFELIWNLTEGGNQ